MSRAPQPAWMSAPPVDAKPAWMDAPPVDESPALAAEPARPDWSGAIASTGEAIAADRLAGDREIPALEAVRAAKQAEYDRAIQAWQNPSMAEMRPLPEPTFTQNLITGAKQGWYNALPRGLKADPGGMPPAYASGLPAGGAGGLIGNTAGGLVPIMGTPEGMITTALGGAAGRGLANVMGPVTGKVAERLGGRAAAAFEEAITNAVPGAAQAAAQHASQEDWDGDPVGALIRTLSAAGVGGALGAGTGAAVGSARTGPAPRGTMADRLAAEKAAPYGITTEESARRAQMDADWRDAQARGRAQGEFVAPGEVPRPGSEQIGPEADAAVFQHGVAPRPEDTATSPLPAIPEQRPQTRPEPLVASSPVPSPDSTAPPDTARVMGTDSALSESMVSDGVRYELYKDTAGPGGAVRVFDADSGEVVSIRSFPSAVDADAAYREAVAKFKTPDVSAPPAPPAGGTPPAPAGEPLPSAPMNGGEVLYHGTQSADPFDTFKPKSYGTAGEHGYYYFSDSPRVMQRMIKGGASDNVSPVKRTIAARVNVRRPLDLTGIGSVSPREFIALLESKGVRVSDEFRRRADAAPSADVKRSVWQMFRFDTPTTGDLRQSLVDAGYDGVKWKEWDATTTAAFRPDQIRIEPSYADLRKEAQSLGVLTTGPRTKAALAERVAAARATLARGNPQDQARVATPEVERRAPDGSPLQDQSGGSPGTARNQVRIPAEAPAREPTRGEFSKADIERRLIAFKDEHGFESGTDLTDAQADAAGADMLATSFDGPVPTEIKEWLEGQPASIRMKFRGNVPGARGQDVWRALGDDEYFRRVSEYAAAEVGKAVDLAKKMAEVRPDAALLAYIHENLPTKQKNRPPWHVVDKPAETLEDGTTLSIGGRPFEVVRDDDGVMYMVEQVEDSPDPFGFGPNPMSVPLAPLDAIPVDAGTLVKPKRATELYRGDFKPVEGQQKGLFGERSDGGISGKQQELPMYEPSRADQEAKAEAAKRGDVLDKEIGTLPMARRGGNADIAPPTQPAAQKVTPKPPPAVSTTGQRSVAMPELVKIATELSGSVPLVRKLMDARGRFTGGGKIKIDPDTAKDPAQLARTMAHEIGHLTDWLPDKTLSRGNVLARALSLRPTLNHLGKLRHFMADTFPIAGATNKELRGELMALSQKWRGWNPAKLSAKDRRYFQSARELYADALSVWLNDPARLEKEAPKFYKELNTHLDRKPEVQRAYQSVQDLLAGMPAELARARRADIREDYARGETIMRERAEERDGIGRSAIQAITQALFDTAGPVISKERKMLRLGIKPADEKSAIIALEELALRDSPVHLMLDKYEREAHRPLFDSGVTEADVGEYMQMRRVAAGDRSELANPRGYTPETAKEMLDNLEAKMGPDRWAAMQHAVRVVDELGKDAWADAVDAGIISKDLYENTIKPNEGKYATFAVLDYLEDYVPAAVGHQVGTFKSVANPLAATMLKLVSVRRAIEFNKAKRTVLLDTIGKHFPDEIVTHRPGKGMNPPRPEPGKAQMVMYEDGKPIHVETDKYVAAAFGSDRPTWAAELSRALGSATYKAFHPLYVTWSLGFQAFNIPKDFLRTYRNLGAAANSQGSSGPSLAELAGAYIRAISAAKRRAFGQYSAVVDAMLQDKALSKPFTRAFHGYDEAESTALDRIAEKYGVLSRPDTRTRRAAAIEAGSQVLGFVENATNFTEYLPKVAAYNVLGRRGINGDRRAYIVRNFVGTPNTARRGEATYLTNSIWMYSNVALQGLRSDAALALGRDPILGPTTKGGFWLREVTTTFVPKMVMRAAAAGLFGAGVKAIFDLIPDDDKAKYTIVPLGTTTGGDGKVKARYLRLPYDHTSQTLAAATWYLSEKQPDKAVDVVRGMVPNASPWISIPNKWAQFVSGINPRDDFRNREIVGRDEWDAGGWYAAKDMIRWTAGEFGAVSDIGRMVIGRDKAPEPMTTEQRIANLPGLSRLIRITDRGMTEQQWSEADLEDREGARFRLGLPDEARKLVSERYRLHRVGVENLSMNDRLRLAYVDQFYRAAYLPITKAMKVFKDSRQTERFDQMQQELASLATATAGKLRSQKPSTSRGTEDSASVQPR